MADRLGNLEGFGEPLRSRLAPLRELVLAAAASSATIGPLAESLKWGEPSYTPARKGVGSSVRIAPRKDGKLAMNFICHTGLVDRFRQIYPDRLAFEGNRTIIIDPAAPLPSDELRHCVGLALTYFVGK